MVRFTIDGEIKDIKINLTKDVPDDRDFKLSTLDAGTMPNFVDHTPKMSPVKNQGRLGSCVGFASAAMKEWQEQIEHEREVAEGKRDRRKKRGLDSYDLSEAWIYWKCKEIDPWPDSEGTSIRCAMQVLHKNGVPCENAYPYSDKFKGKPKFWAKLIAKWGLIDSYWRCDGLNELRMGLLDGPVVIGVGVFEEFFNSIIIPYPSNPDNVLGGHAICAVGYDNDEGLIKFKNSWGNNWGENGYGYLPYKYIDHFMWDAWIAKDLSVTRRILKEKRQAEKREIIKHQMKHRLKIKAYIENLKR